MIVENSQIVHVCSVVGSAATAASIRLPLLITGVTGVAGYNAWQFFRRLFGNQVIGIRPPKTFRLMGDGIEAVDVADHCAVGYLFEKHRFGSVLHCAGNCALKACELDPEMAFQINVTGARNLAEEVFRFQSRLVALSTDLVFSGTHDGNYSETDAVDPVTVYGKTMAQAEELLLSRVPSAALLRISLPMGPSWSRHAGAIDWIESRFRNNRPATLYFDEVRSASYVDDMNLIYLRFLQESWNGLYHLGGPRPVTLYEIAQVINRVGGYRPELLKGCPREQAGPIPPRAGNVSMCSDKLTALLGGVRPRAWPWRDAYHPTHRQWHWERPGAEHRSYHALVNHLYRYPRRPPANPTFAVRHPDSALLRSL